MEDSAAGIVATQYDMEVEMASRVGSLSKSGWKKLIEELKLDSNAMMMLRLTVHRQIEIQKAITLKLEFLALNLNEKAIKLEIDSRIHKANSCIQKLAKIINNTRSTAVLSDVRQNNEEFRHYITLCIILKDRLGTTNVALQDRLNRTEITDITNIEVCLPSFPEIYKQVYDNSRHESKMRSPKSRALFHPYSERKTRTMGNRTPRMNHATVNESQSRTSEYRDLLSEHQIILSEYQWFFAKHNIFLSDYVTILNESKGSSTFNDALVKACIKLCENGDFLSRHAALLDKHESFLYLHPFLLLDQEITLSDHQVIVGKYTDFIKEHKAFLVEHQAIF